MNQGAKVIGHVKTYLEYESGFLHANTVGETGDVTVNGRDGNPVNHVRLVVNAIVYGITSEVLKEATEGALAELFLKYGFTRKP
jgi:hypothetical protein